MAYLKDLTELRALDLHGTQVSDAGLTQLAQLKNLELLSLGNTNVTDAGVAKLQRELPQEVGVLR